MPLRSRPSCLVAALILSAALVSCSRSPASSSASIPRTADGKPDLHGIWQVRNRAAADLEDHVARHGMPAGKGVVQGGPIPYQPWAAAKKIENAKNRLTADPLANCYLPGVPRIMYMEFPFQIFQTPDHIAMTFEWSQVHRTIYTNGAPAPDGIDFWMGDSRGRWEGDTLVVDVRNHNDRTWFDMAGNFHSEALHLVERYTMRDANTITYEVTIEDPKVFTRPWTISMPLHRQTEADRIFEYQCQAEAEEANGAFEPDAKTWYPGPSVPVQTPADWKDVQTRVESRRRQRARSSDMADGKPDLQGYFMPDGGGANYGLGKHEVDFLTPGGRGVIVDPPDRHAADAGVGEGRGREPQDARARLRRSDGALLRRGRAALDVRAVAASDSPAARLRRHPARAHVVADDPARRPRTSAGSSAVVAGRLDRPLGRRYAGRRDDQSQWEGVVERGG